MTKRFLFLFLWLLWMVPSHAQKDTLAANVLLDDFVVAASNDGFNVEDFIKQVRTDTTYYKAFQNLRYYGHKSIGNVEVYNRKSKEKGTMDRLGSHHLNNGWHWVVIEEEQTTGKIKNKKGEYRYYTVEMFDNAFYPSDSLRANNSVGDYRKPMTYDSKKQKHKNDIKIMMFNPGAEISDIPIVGKKMAIFDDHMVPYYDYKIWQYDYKGNIPCYAFTCKAKPEFAADKTVIKDLTSYFNIETMEVMKREYHMKYKSLLFEFDVKIDVDLEKIGDALVPVLITYSGFWDVSMKKPEYINFRVKCSDYQIPAK